MAREGLQFTQDRVKAGSYLKRQKARLFQQTQPDFVLAKRVVDAWPWIAVTGSIVIGGEALLLLLLLHRCKKREEDD